VNGLFAPAVGDGEIFKHARETIMNGRGLGKSGLPLASHSVDQYRAWYANAFRKTKTTTPVIET
jgi:hypothetical protein